MKTLSFESFGAAILGAAIVVGKVLADERVSSLFGRDSMSVSAFGVGINCLVECTDAQPQC